MTNKPNHETKRQNLEPGVLGYGLSLLTAGAALLGVTPSAHAADKKPTPFPRLRWEKEVRLRRTALTAGGRGFRLPA
jgi:hypothetical protein